MKQRTRRQVMQDGARWGLGAAALTALGCAGPVTAAPNRAFLRTPLAGRPGHAVVGWYRSTDVDAACQQVLERLGGLPWLGRGDSVFVKVACNSSNEHPAVTSPEAVRAVVRLLRDGGAGTVYVGDQAGVEHVRLTASGRESSTQAVMAENGLLEAIRRSGATLHNFDDQGWNGYLAPPDDFANHWDGTLRLARILGEVDHVVNLPRLGTHAVAGYTCAIKNAVGWLRDDSRLHLHGRGDSFFEQLAEISLFSPLRDKLRLSLSLGTKALVNVGPDIGEGYDVGGVLALGSTSLLDHDAVAAALLPWLDRQGGSGFDLYTPYPEDSDFWNRRLVAETWGNEAARDYRQLVAYRLGRSMAHDRCLAHCAVLLGERPSRILVERDGDGHPAGLVAHLSAAADGLFTL